MPAVLHEAGSIINGDEELQMNLPERRDVISAAVITAVGMLCHAPLLRSEVAPGHVGGCP
jgi:hypothetical protein